MKIRTPILLLTLVLSVACASKKGRINLQTEPPGAEVYIRGEKVGETPVSFDYDYRTPGGLEISKDGYYTISEVLSKAWIRNEYQRGNYKEAEVIMDGVKRKAWVVSIQRTLSQKREIPHYTSGTVSEKGTAITKKADAGTSKEKLAVMDLQAKYGVEQKLAEGLSVVVRDTIQNLGNHEVLSKDDVELIAKRTALTQSLGCDDTQCLIDIGRSLGTKFMVAGAISKFGDTYNVSLRLINTKGEDVGVKKRVNRNCKCPEDELIEAVRVVSSLLIE